MPNIIANVNLVSVVNNTRWKHILFPNASTRKKKGGGGAYEIQGLLKNN